MVEIISINQHLPSMLNFCTTDYIILRATNEKLELLQKNKIRRATQQVEARDRIRGGAAIVSEGIMTPHFQNMTPSLEKEKIKIPHFHWQNDPPHFSFAK